ncbi:hypothetical protein [Tunturiibacter gelidoferens]|uniref:Uncharacterized protein n=1 Tax=Tunturiibacter gelidiferens TaxID=3069689 RepID=A0A9X0U7B9_9BACT|nr:hypothetical protein [Edaphobacter lichenicola]MBB5330817.1 hypothetical protein [Edaphobacter lichenicola]
MVSETNSWGAAVTLREFAQDPILVHELTAMLNEERPGSLFVAHEMIAAGQKSLSGPAITLSLHYIKTLTTKSRLIHQTLLVSETNSWGAAVTLREFAQDPILVHELTAMLNEERPGSLFVAHEMIAAGQKSLSGPAITLSLHYIKTLTTKSPELSSACSTLRDFGSDQQFGQLVSEIKNAQYLNTLHYDALWRATIWPESPRAATILQILLHDDRMYQGMRYRDLAHNELERNAKLTN